MPIPFSPASPQPSPAARVQPAVPANAFSLGELPAFPRAQCAVESAHFIETPAPVRRGILGSVRQGRNPAARAATPAVAASRLKASLEQAKRENWTPAEISYVACAAIKAHNELSQDPRIPLPERAGHLQWCVESYDACGPMDLDRGFMADLTRRAGIAFLECGLEESRLPIYRAAEMNRRALEFGASEHDAFAGLKDWMLGKTGYYSLHLEHLSKAEISAIAAGRLPWPSMAVNHFEKRHELAEAAARLDRCLSMLDPSRQLGTAASFFVALHEVIESLDARHGHYFSPVLHARLARELGAMEASQVNKQACAFAGMALDFYFPQQRQYPSLDVPLAVFNDCVALGDFSTDRRRVILNMYTWAISARIPNAFETYLSFKDEFDMHLLDRGEDLSHRTHAGQTTLADRLGKQRKEEADAEILRIGLPADVANIVKAKIEPANLNQVRAEHSAEHYQNSDNNRSINDFVATLARASAFDYSNGNLLRLFGRLYLGLRETQTDPAKARFLLAQLCVQVGQAREDHPDKQLRGMLDETLALFSPEMSLGSHDLPALLLRAADGFIETASLQSTKESEVRKKNFHESWKVLLDRVNNCDFTGKEQLRASLLEKLMAFAKHHPEQASWVIAALNWFEHDERYPVRPQLWQLQQSAKQA